MHAYSLANQYFVSRQILVDVQYPDRLTWFLVRWRNLAGTVILKLG